MNNKTKTKKRKTILGCQESNPSLLGERRLVNQMNNRFNIINIFYYNKYYEKKKKKKGKNHSSVAGNRTRVSWVKARYPNRWTTTEVC